ncbi:unnamed protein product [Schistosoma curassoni]|uniref:Ovule protein n=1 Tax=Schistosoma curassoni TaxID=6186 RepID=A0A183KJP7_9TREM|nr:unnamed protein product [Schistosoma curassoni]
MGRDQAVECIQLKQNHQVLQCVSQEMSMLVVRGHHEPTRTNLYNGHYSCCWTFCCPLHLLFDQLVSKDESYANLKGEAF